MSLSDARARGMCRLACARGNPRFFVSHLASICGFGHSYLPPQVSNAVVPDVHIVMKGAQSGNGKCPCCSQLQTVTLHVCNGGDDNL